VPFSSSVGGVYGGAAEKLEVGGLRSGAGLRDVSANLTFFD